MPGPRKVTVTEVGPRDGWQIERDFIPTATKIELINELVGAGVPIIEYSSFVSPRAVPQLADAAEVLQGVDRSKGTRFAALVPNAKGAERAAEAGVDEIRVFVSASESHNRKNVNRSVEGSLKGFEDVVRIADEAGIPVEGAIATSFGCPFEGDVPVAQVGMIARRFRDLGMQGVGLGDTTGMATPTLVAERCRYLKEHVPELPIALHFHNTRGIGLVNVMAGLAEGIDIYESSFAGLGGCPFAAGCHRQHLHRGPGLPAARDGHRDRHRPRAPVRRRAPRRAGDRAHPARPGDEGGAAAPAASGWTRSRPRSAERLAAVRHPRRRPHPHPRGAVLHAAARRPRRRRGQGRGAGPGRPGARPGRDQGRPQLVLRPVQSQQALDHARPLSGRGQAGAGRPAPRRRRAGRELPPRRARQDGLPRGAPHGAQPAPHRGQRQRLRQRRALRGSARRSTSSPRR